MKLFFKQLLLLIAFVLVSCEPKFKPNNFVFTETREIQGVMVYAADKAFDGKVVTPGLSPGFLSGDTTYFIYGHFDQDFPCTIAGVTLNFLDTVCVLGCTSEAKDYNKSTYHVVDIVEVLEVKHSLNE